MSPRRAHPEQAKFTNLFGESPYLCDILASAHLPSRIFCTLVSFGVCGRWGGSIPVSSTGTKQPSANPPSTCQQSIPSAPYPMPPPRDGTGLCEGNASSTCLMLPGPRSTASSLESAYSSSLPCPCGGGGLVNCTSGSRKCQGYAAPLCWEGQSSLPLPARTAGRLWAHQHRIPHRASSLHPFRQRCPNLRAAPSMKGSSRTRQRPYQIRRLPPRYRMTTS